MPLRWHRCAPAAAPTMTRARSDYRRAGRILLDSQRRVRREGARRGPPLRVCRRAQFDGRLQRAGDRILRAAAVLGEIVHARRGPRLDLREAAVHRRARGAEALDACGCEAHARRTVRQASARARLAKGTLVKNFALTGAAGYIAPRHLEAIKSTGNRLVAAVDPHDAVGVLDRYSFDVRFFTEIERFDRHLEKLRRGPEADRVHYVSICSPNYLHDAHIRLALRVGADALCEKPLVINPWNLDGLADLERESGRRVNTVLQLRLHPQLIALRERLAAAKPKDLHDVALTYVTARGSWYDVSWKGSDAHSGGIVTN